MIYNHDFDCENGQHQVFQSKSKDMPCMCRYPDPSHAVSETVPWHWHSEIEINYVTEGTFIVYTTDQIFHVHKGEAIFLNSNALHMTHWENSESAGKFISIIFDPSFIGGIYGSVPDQKYIQPVLHCEKLKGYKISPDTETHLEMLLQITKIYNLFRDEPFGYELLVRNALTSFWCPLLTETNTTRSASSRNFELISERIKPMIECIHALYPEKLTLDQIARSGNVSKRECNRLFHKYLYMTPMNYVSFYRIRMAAHKLQDLQKSIETISYECGFHSVSYMAKLFRSEYNCTPNEYRSKLKHQTNHEI